MSFPSGEMSIPAAATNISTTCRGCPPSAETIHADCSPVRDERKTIERLSGVTTGFHASPAISNVGRLPSPSAFHSPFPLVNTSMRPSGEAVVS